MEQKRFEGEFTVGSKASVGRFQFLTTWWQRGEFLSAMIVIHLLDHMVSDNLTKSNMLTPWGNEIVATFELAGGFLLMVLAVASFIAIVRPFDKLIIPLVSVYLASAVAHLAVNVGAILITAQVKRGETLIQLWDVVDVYFMGVFIFTVWYWFLDRITPGGAFIFSAQPDSQPVRRTLVDYLFLSFSTSATFGPTTEPPTTRVAKVLMMIQVCSSLVVLMVLLARALSG
ncbi:MAG: hypothetical protein WAW37_02210 [Syntrophobacteraceae bacterium]